MLKKDNKNCLFNHNIDLKNYNLPFYYKVYYTDIKLSKIVNANEGELKNILKNSKLIYESNYKLTRD